MQQGRGESWARNAPLLVLNFGLDIVDCVRGLNLEGDCLSCECLDEDLHLHLSLWVGVCSDERALTCVWLKAWEEKGGAV